MTYLILTFKQCKLLQTTVIFIIHIGYLKKSGYLDEKKFAFTEAFTSTYREPSETKYPVLI